MELKVQRCLHFQVLGLISTAHYVFFSVFTLSIHFIFPPFSRPQSLCRLGTWPIKDPHLPVQYNTSPPEDFIWDSQLSSFELLISCAQCTSTEHWSSQLKSTKPKWSHLKSSHVVTSTQVILCYFKTSSQLKLSLLKCTQVHLSQVLSNLRNCSPQNKNPVIIYSPYCRSISTWLSSSEHKRRYCFENSQ